MPGCKKNGFTLVEALVAITILILGVLGPLSVATRGITDGLIAKDEITATQLAQEGVELVRTKIASDYKADKNSFTSWLSGLDACISSAPCKVEVKNNFYFPCTPLPSQGCSIRYRSADGIYVEYNSTDLSQFGVVFNRTIQITKPSVVSPMTTTFGDPEVEVTVVVSWLNKTQLRSVNLSNYIYNPW